jgi:hypothetical protein
MEYLLVFMLYRTGVTQIPVTNLEACNKIGNKLLKDSRYISKYQSYTCVRLKE